ncbi:hypothetical protein SLEP1_g51256 [Rubroshorea leprosula]|uniref:CCHC-type domain-containing protein n=1 Tax=Rubroshorea leprosula TaxID=152421 RepID=A0AAV5M3D4_9ROSI|nr:hypothetical protein SLEP1_g51256 [Rubroshorea leprosula]
MKSLYKERRLLLVIPMHQLPHNLLLCILVLLEILAAMVSSMLGTRQFNGYALKGCGGARGNRGARGGKNNRNSSNMYNGYNANACQLCNGFGHFARNCPELKNHAHVANFATISTLKKGDWWIDSGAFDHVTLDLATLALHLEYDGSDELLIGDGSGSNYGGDASSRAQSAWRVSSTPSKSK